MQETVTVKKTYPPNPGKTLASAVLSDGRRMGFNPARVMLQEGGTFVVETSSRDYQGKTYHNIEKVIGAAGNSNAAPAPQSSGRPTDDATAERIYVCGILNAWVANAAYESSVPQVHQLVAVTSAAREAWRQTFGGKPVAPKADPNGPDDGADMPF